MLKQSFRRRKLIDMFNQPGYHNQVAGITRFKLNAGSYLEPTVSRKWVLGPTADVVCSHLIIF